MKNKFLLILVAGLLMNSADSMCSQEQNIYKVVGQTVVGFAVITGTACVCYNLGKYSKPHSFEKDQNMACVSMDYVEQRMNLKKTGLDPKDELSMPALEFVPESKTRLQQVRKIQQKRLFESEIEKYHFHHGLKTIG